MSTAEEFEGPGTQPASLEDLEELDVDSASTVRPMATQAVFRPHFDDSDGVRLPTPGGAGFGNDQNAWEVTGTFKVVLAEGLMFRTEYRYDAAHNSLYEKDLVGDDDTRDDQHTIAGELSYVF